MRIPAMKKKQRVFAGMFLLVVAWIFAYNLAAFGMQPVQAFFSIAGTKNIILADALSFALISSFIVGMFVFADVLAQIMSSTQGFAKLEKMLEKEHEVGLGKFLISLTKLEDVKVRKEDVPENFSSVLMYSGMMYSFCFLFIVAFSSLAYVSITGLERQALSAVSGIAIPLFAAALPASARFLAIFGYSKAREYSALIPYSLFTVALLFLLALFGTANVELLFMDALNTRNIAGLLHSALYLSFVPVFIEAGWWLYKIEKEE